MPRHSDPPRDDLDRWVKLLAEFNRQREKSFDEKLREQLASVNPAEAYQALVEHRRERSSISGALMVIRGAKHRHAISAAKMPMVQAIKRIVEQRKRFWPLSDRAIHYAILNKPPLKHASKPSSRYRNDDASYNSLVELVTRMRLFGLLPMESIADETRPVTDWGVHRETTSFVKEQIGGFLKGYWRDLMQSQPNHVEILAEKNTIAPILREVSCSSAFR